MGPCLEELVIEEDSSSPNKGAPLAAVLLLKRRRAVGTTTDDAGPSVEAEDGAARRFLRRPAKGAALEATAKAMDFCVRGSGGQQENDRWERYGMAITVPSGIYIYSDDFTRDLPYIREDMVWPAVHQFLRWRALLQPRNLILDENLIRICSLSKKKEKRKKSYICR